MPSKGLTTMHPDVPPSGSSREESASAIMPGSRIGLVVMLLVAAAVGGAAAAPDASWAAPERYWGAHYGIVVREDVDDGRTNASFGVTVEEVHFEPPCCRSWEVGLTVGFETDRAWLTRWETDFVFQSVDVNQFTRDGGIVEDGFGDWESLYLTLNGYHDFERWQSIQPYAGLGVGAAWMASDANGRGLIRPTQNEGDLAPMGQGMLGIRYPAGSSVVGSLEYRYSLTGGFEFTDQDGNTYTTGSVRDHRFLLGVDVGF